MKISLKSVIKEESDSDSSSSVEVEKVGSGF